MSRRTGREDWLRDGRPSGTQLQDWDGPAPQLLKGEKGLLDAIENRRRRVRELRADLHRIESAPYPSSWAKQRGGSTGERRSLAQRGAPDVTNVLEHDAGIVWPMSRVQSEVFAEQRALAFAEVPDTLALTCWLHKDALIAALDREISSEADDKAALTHEARQKAEAELMGDLLDIERQEAALVWRAMDEKLPAEHRHDCSPQAVLQVRLVTVPRAIDGPSTSPLTFDIVLGGRR